MKQQKNQPVGQLIYGAHPLIEALKAKKEKLLAFIQLNLCQKSGVR